MGNPAFFVDVAPFIASSGVVVDALGNATATGATTLFTKPFKINAKTSFSFFVQSSAGSTGVATATASPGTPAANTAWKIQASNWDQDSKGAAYPAQWFDVTGSYGAADTHTFPGVHNFKGAFTGASQNDFFSSWVCPYAFIRFALIQASGTGIYSGQFYSGEV